MKKLLLGCGVFLLTASANASLITDENFETGATGWSNNTTTNGGIPFTSFLGRFGGTGGLGSINKTYTLSGTQTSVTVEFDFYEIDSWDGESFFFYVNDSLVYADTFQLNNNDFLNTSNNADSLLFGNGSENLGFAFWSDQGFHYSHTFNTTATTLKIGFGTNLNQSIVDESWGIDNVKIIDDVSTSVPEPTSLALLSLGLAGFGFSRKKA